MSKNNIKRLIIGERTNMFIANRTKYNINKKL